MTKGYIPKAIKECKTALRINFSTHSLGGIVLRKHLSENNVKGLYRVVVPGPPDKGSEVINPLRNVPSFNMIHGLAGMQLETEATSILNSINPADYPASIIVGTLTIHPILSLMPPNPDDGKVSVFRTKPEGMSDHITCFL